MTGWLPIAREVLDRGFVVVRPDGTWTHDLAYVPDTDVTDTIEGGDMLDPDQGVILDRFTASMLVGIHDNLSEANAARFAAMPLDRAVDFGWKLTARVRDRRAS